MSLPFMTPGIHTPAGGGSDATITFTDSDSVAVAGTTHTFTAATMGSGSHVLVCVTGNNGSAVTVDSISVGANSATLTARASDAQFAAWGIASNPNPGGTDDITVTFSASSARSAIAVYAVDNVDTLTAHDTAFTETVTTSVATASIDIPAGGIAVAMAFNNSGSITWSSQTGVTTEDADFAFASGRSASFCSGAFASTQTGLSVSTTWSSTANQPLFAVASWG